MLGLEHRNMETGAGFPARAAMGGVQGAGKTSVGSAHRRPHWALSLSLVVLFPLGACVGNQDDLCDFGCTIADDWVDEGDGLISQSANGMSDTGDTSFSFELVRCETGRSMTVLQFSNVMDEQAPDFRSLADQIAAYRNKSGLSDTGKFVAWLKQAGYKPTIGQLHPENVSTAKACKKLYPKMARNWPEKSAEQIDREAKANSPENIRVLEEAVLGGLTPMAGKE